MFSVTARTPTRIDLAGGTLDLWPIHHLLDAKATVNVGVTLDAEVNVKSSLDGLFRIISDDQGIEVSGTFAEIIASRQLPLFGLLLKALWDQSLPAVTITAKARSPAGAGLGGSSCLGIAIAGALRAAPIANPRTKGLSEEDTVRIVQDVEARLIRSPTGIQDYWGGMRGRVNILRFPFGRVDVETLSPSKLVGLEDELILCYSGRSRQSAINNWEIFKRLFDGDKGLLEIFNRIGKAAEDCASAVQKGDLEHALACSRAEWAMRVELWPNIETAETKRLDQAARRAGAYFSRVCGAGGGGVMAVFASRGAHAAVIAALKSEGGNVLDATVADYGLTIV